MRIVLFGANGRLGKSLNRQLSQKHEVLPYTRNEFDFNTDHDHMVLENICFDDPDVIINATACNGLEVCDKDPLRALRVNAHAPAVLATAAKIINALFIHFSTDYVFSGQPEGLYEGDTTHPYGNYGQSKYLGEQAVAMTAGDHYIFRLSSLYGEDFAGVLQPIQQVQQGKGTEEDPVKVLRQACAPTSTYLVASTVASVLDQPRNLWSGLSGLYHLATTKPVWKEDFTKYLLEQVFAKDFCVTVGELAIPRPVHSVLRTHKFSGAFGIELPTWQADLNKVLPLLLPRPV